LQEPTVLARQPQAISPQQDIFKWQRFLATYAYWYADGTRWLRDDTGRFVPLKRISEHLRRHLAFVRALQQSASDPPPLPVFEPSAFPPDLAWIQYVAHAITSTPTFSRECWPHFHTKGFLSLYLALRPR
jgi:hypothetical protein